MKAKFNLAVLDALPKGLIVIFDLGIEWRGTVPNHQMSVQFNSEFFIKMTAAFFTLSFLHGRMRAPKAVFI